MLDFDKHKNAEKSTNQHVARYRRQLVLMFAALGLTFYGVHWASKPEHWNWLFVFESHDENARKKQDHELKQNSLGNLVEIQPGEPKPPIRDQTLAQTIQPPNYFEDIDDSSTGLLRRELPAYYRLLNLARSLESSDWDEKNITIASLNLLNQSPSSYREHKLHLSGDAMYITKYKEPENDYGFLETYEIWLRTRDSGNDLYRIRALSLPEGVKEGKQQTHLNVYALFFKRQSYASMNGNRLSPLLVSNRVEIPVSMIAPINKFKNLFFYIGTGFMLVVTALVTWHYFSDKRFENEVIDKMKDLSPEEKAALDAFILPSDENDIPIDAGLNEQQVKTPENAG